MADPALKEVHPLGKSPVITVETPASPKPIVIAESAAIVEYIVDYYGQSMIPKRYQEGREGEIGGETESWLRYRQLMHYAEGSFMTIMMQALVVLRIQNAPVPFFIKPVTNSIASKFNTSYIWPNMKTHHDYLEGLLKTSPDGGEWFCGNQLTGADILLSFPLLAAQQRSGMKKEDYPLMEAYVARFQEREAYKRAVAKIEALEGEGSFKALI